MADLPDEIIALYEPVFSYMGIDFFRTVVVKHLKCTRTTQAWGGGGGILGSQLSNLKMIIKISS